MPECQPLEAGQYGTELKQTHERRVGQHEPESVGQYAPESGGQYGRNSQK